MSNLQIKDLPKTRQYQRDHHQRSGHQLHPGPEHLHGPKIRRGLELYRLADLSRVWVLADLFENEAQYVHPGEKVKVTYPYQDEKTLEATVSEVLPIFDPTTRDPQGAPAGGNGQPPVYSGPICSWTWIFPLNFPPTVNVPVDAIMDSGLTQTVFVTGATAYFDPEGLETGWRLGDRVEIVEGLEPGERIVVSGNFLIDSESRMKLAAAGFFGEVVKDPVCGSMTWMKQGQTRVGKAT